MIDLKQEENFYDMHEISSARIMHVSNNSANDKTKTAPCGPLDYILGDGLTDHYVENRTTIDKKMRKNLQLGLKL